MGNVSIIEAKDQLDFDSASSNINKYVISGKKYADKSYDASSTIESGSMQSYGSNISRTLEHNSSYTIPEGYHDGNGILTIKSIKSYTSDTNSNAKSIYSGYTGFINGVKTTGTGYIENISSCRISGASDTALTIAWTNPSSGFWGGVEIWWANGSKIGSTSSNAYTVSGLAKNTTYYFRLRSYVYINDSIVYSGWATTSLGGTTTCSSNCYSCKDCDYDAYCNCVGYCETC